MAPAIDRHDALIVAHGSPSDPVPQEGAIKALAARIEGALPGWTVKGATLAMPGSVEAAMAELENPLVFPFFMAPGWFTDTYLPKRLGPRAWDRLAPLGVDPELPRLVTGKVQRTLATKGVPAGEATLVIAAHGSPKHPESGRAVRRFAAALAARLKPRALQVGFIEESPRLSEAAQVRGPAVCVPFFASDAGHFAEDLPAALSSAGFTGPALPPLIRYPGIDMLVSRVLIRATRARRAA